MRGTSRRVCSVAGAALLLGTVSAVCVAQQPAPVSPPGGLGCVLQFQDHYLCNREAFQSRLARAQTVQVSVARMELFAGKQMRELVGASARLK